MSVASAGHASAPNRALVAGCMLDVLETEPLLRVVGREGGDAVRVPLGNGRSFMGSTIIHGPWHESPRRRADLG